MKQTSFGWRVGDAEDAADAVEIDREASDQATDLIAQALVAVIEAAQELDDER